MMLALGGGLLLLPGFISDVLGLLCLLPFTRHLAARKMRQRAEAQAMRQRAFGMTRSSLVPTMPAIAPM